MVNKSQQASSIASLADRRRIAPSKVNKRKKQASLVGSIDQRRIALTISSIADSIEATIGGGLHRNTKFHKKKNKSAPELTSL